MSVFARRLLLVALATAIPATASAVRLSWFDDPYAAGGSAQVRTGSLLNAEANRARFDISFLSEQVAAERGEMLPQPSLLTLSGSFRGLAGVSERAPLPEEAVRRESSFGLTWQHRLDSRDRLAVSAEYGENVSRNPFAQDTADTRAVLSFTRAWGDRYQPALTGSVFVGDEAARDDSFRYLGRRYVGISVGGQLTLSQSHTPYVAFQMRRSYYEMGNGMQGTGSIPAPTLSGDSLGVPRIDDRSLLTAGWRWQATRDLSLQAEASYGLQGGQDFYSPERSRVFFGTRFDFR